jgi:hypothetical protein
MEITQSSKGEVTVLEQHIIRVNSKYHISPSRGYLGIIHGIVQVNDIILKPEQPTTDVYCEVEGIIEAHVEAEVQGMEDAEAAFHIENLYSEPWILYSYPHDRAEAGEYYCIPLSMFIGHTSSI